MDRSISHRRGPRARIRRRRTLAAVTAVVVGLPVLALARPVGPGTVTGPADLVTSRAADGQDPFGVDDAGRMRAGSGEPGAPATTTGTAAPGPTARGASAGPASGGLAAGGIGAGPAVRTESADTAPLRPVAEDGAGAVSGDGTGALSPAAPSPSMPGVPEGPPRWVTGAEAIEPFVLIGFSWSGPDDVTARFRVHTATGWGAWRPLVRHADHGPDADQAASPGPEAPLPVPPGPDGPDPTRTEPAEPAPAGAAALRVALGSVATDPVWVGPADGWQLGIDGDASAVRVHLVRADAGDGSPAGPGSDTPTEESEPGTAFDRYRSGATGSAPLPVIGPWSGIVPAPALTVGRPVERPVVAPRSQWAARAPSIPTWTATSLRLAVVHHTGSGESATYTRADVPVMLRSMQAYHMDVNGWLDLGYNVVIDRFGRIWEGREGGPDALTVGAHAEGMNTGSVGVALLGDFSAAAPSPEAVDALGRFLAWKLFRHGADPARTGTMLPRTANRFPALVPVTLPRIVGHQDVSFTGCPGNVEPLLPAIRADVRRRWSAMAAATSALGDAAVWPTPRGIPTAGDFDKDGDDDIVWYRPGPDPDRLWRSTGSGGFVVTEFDIPDGGGAGARTTRLDWDGDGATDLLVSTPGRNTVTLVRGVPKGTVRVSTLDASGDAVPVVGDFDADGDDDVLFYLAGVTTLPLAEWNGAGGAIVTNLTLTGGPFRPVAGDVDGDLRADVLWYGPGATADVLWTSQGGRRFGSRSVTMAGDHQPVTADLDGDQRTDVVWRTATGGSTVVWLGGSTFTPTTVDVGPAVRSEFGDLDGDGADDVITVSGDAVATVWSRLPGAGWSPRREAVADGAAPLLLDLDGDGRTEILWWVDGGDAGLWRTL